MANRRPASVQMTAALIAVILKRYGKDIGRISDEAYMLIAGRRRILRPGSRFNEEVADEISEYGWVMAPLAGGGLGFVKDSALAETKCVSPFVLFSDEEIAKLRDRKFSEDDWNDAISEIQDDYDAEEDID